MSKSTVTRKDALVYGGAAAGGLVLGGAAVAGIAAAVDANKAALPVEGIPIAARYLSGELPVDDPDDSAWTDAARVRVPLTAQQIAPPVLEKAGVAGLDVRAIHNGTRVAFLLEWDDPKIDDLDGIRRYHDAAAVQLPARAGSTPPALMMGAPGAPVHILQWRATWQRDIDSGGRTGVDQIYPEVVHDVMPDDVLPPSTAQLYWVGREVGNPLSQVGRRSPVEEVVAEGFGSVTHFHTQRTVGHGRHEDGGWRVIVALPSARIGIGDPLAPGTAWPVAFAVWLGSQENRGGRKHIANWQTLQLENAA
jgi:hypothetical protein